MCSAVMHSNCRNSIVIMRVYWPGGFRLWWASWEIDRIYPETSESKGKRQERESQGLHQWKQRLCMFDVSSKYCFFVFVTIVRTNDVWFLNFPEPLPFYCGKSPCVCRMNLCLQTWKVNGEGWNLCLFWVVSLATQWPFGLDMFRLRETKYTELLGETFVWIYGILLWQMILGMDVGLHLQTTFVQFFQPIWISRLEFAMHDQKLELKTLGDRPSHYGCNVPWWHQMVCRWLQ